MPVLVLGDGMTSLTLALKHTFLLFYCNNTRSLSFCLSLSHTYSPVAFLFSAAGRKSDRLKYKRTQ